MSTSLLASILPHAPLSPTGSGLAQRPAAWLWTYGACLAFLVATAYAIAVVVFRLPFSGLSDGRLFRISLALHVELAVFFWLMSTSAAQWAAADGRTSRLNTALPCAAMLGTLVLAFSPLAGGTPTMADYFPWLAANTVFATGFAIFCLAITGMALGAALRLVRGREAATWRGVGRSALPVIASVAAAASAVLKGATNITDVAWAAGHTLLFAHVAMMCWEWSKLSGSNSRLEPMLGCFLAGTSLALPAIPLVFVPGSSEYHLAFTRAMQWLLWPPAAVAAMVSISAILRSSSARPLARLVLFISIGLFFAGSLLGAFIDGATTLVTAHYHAAVGAVAISRMGMLYLAGAELAPAQPSWGAARRQIVIYTIGLVCLAGGLAIGAVDAAPRKTSAAETVNKGPWFRTGMSISGIGGLFAMAGSIWLVINLGWRRRSEPPSSRTPSASTQPNVPL